MSIEQEAAREQARNEGRENPDRAWILTFFDTWEPNPFYSGPKAPHPELDADDEPPDPGQRGPCPGHKFVCTGTAYGGDDESYHGEGRSYCIHCGADGDA